MVGYLPTYLQRNRLLYLSGIVLVNIRGKDDETNSDSYELVYHIYTYSVDIIHKEYIQHIDMYILEKGSP